jgi:glycine C-acetyltransferase
MSEFLHGKEVLLYPTGWAAGFGAVQGLVRADDHVVMDVLTHSCMQEGARAATRNIHFHGHLNVESATRKLKQIREKDAVNGILVVTESLFSMHSDTPDLAELKRACAEYGATLLVDVAHDLGCLGEAGLGHVGLQNMLDDVDILVGSFSKTFAANGGFVATRTRAAKEYLKYYSSSQTFSNALSPIQAAVVMGSLGIIRSAEGRALRNVLMDNVLNLRQSAAAGGLEVLGDPSPIVPIHVGAEGVARLATTRLAELGVIANLVEYPAVPKGGARFRLQVMAAHGRADIEKLVAAMRTAVGEAEQAVQALESTATMVAA